MKSRRLATGAVLFLLAVFARAGEPGAFASPNLTSKGVAALAATCAPCHGPEGRGTGVAAVAPLAGRSGLAARLRELRERPPATLMSQLARGLTDAEIEALSRYFAALAPGSR